MVNRIIKGCMRFPCIINIELTNFCPLNCKQCYKTQNYTHLDFSFLKKIINESIEGGVKKILLSGGEPLEYHYIFETIDLIKSADIFVCLSTSGVGICKETAIKLKKSKIDLLYVSLNGSTNIINSLSREGYTNAIKAMCILAENEVKYRINWVARKDNAYDLPHLIKICKEYGAEGIDILQNKPNSKGELESPLDIGDLKYLKKIYEENIDYLQFQSCFHYKNNDKGFFSGCLAGRASMAIFSDGKFSICPHINEKYDYESIEKYWNNISKDYINDKLCKIYSQSNINEQEL